MITRCSYLSHLSSVMVCAKEEEELILDGKESLWSLEQIQNIIIPEITELLSYAKKGKVYFKHGRKQRMLESSYLITDSLDDLSHTILGESILMLQKYYSSI